MAMDVKFRERAGWLAELAAWVAGLLIVAIVIEALWAAIGQRALGRGGGDFRATVQAVGLELVASLPALFLALALSWLGRVFAAIRDGDALAERTARGLAACGERIVAAAVAQLVITPTLIGWIRDSDRFRIDWEWQTVALGLLGAAVAMLGEVIRAGAVARAELEEIV
jgi:hypothetical protein